jgi:GNAT superfamily N-acetyltransferase
MSNYSVSRISESNVKDLTVIFKNAFGTDFNLDAFQKKQDTKAFGDSYVGFIAYDENNNPAAFYGVYPCKIEYKGSFFLAAQSGDTMTHSDHAGKGLFTMLAQKTYAYCKENGYHLVFGFPNENSFPGFIKRLEWLHFDNLTPYLIRVKCIPWIRLKNTFKLPQSIHDKWCRFHLKKLLKGEPFKSSCLSDDIAVVDHSSDFFNYKSYEENYLVRVRGISIWLKFDDTFMLIGDMEKCSEEKFLDVLKGLKRIAFKLGLPHLRFQCSTNTWGEMMFKKYGTPMSVYYPIGGISFTDKIPLEALKFTGTDNDTF